VFNVHQTDYTLYSLGVPMELHESGAVPATDESKDRVETQRTKIENTVDSFLTYPELYEGGYVDPPTPPGETQEDRRGQTEFQT
jgi:hypothetical protein